MSLTNTTRPTTTTAHDLAEEQRKEKRRAYQREYRASHREKVREWNRTFYLRQAAKLLQENARAAAAAGEGDAR